MTLALRNNAAGGAGDVHVHRNIDQELFQGRGQRCGSPGPGEGVIGIGPTTGNVFAVTCIGGTRSGAIIYKVGV